MENRIDRIEKDLVDVSAEVRELRIMCRVTETEIQSIKQDTSHIVRIFQELDKLNQKQAKAEGMGLMFKLFGGAVLTLVVGAGSIITLLEVLSKGSN